MPSPQDLQHLQQKQQNKTYSPATDEDLRSGQSSHRKLLRAASLLEEPPDQDALIVYRYRLLRWLLIWLGLAVVDLVAAIIIPYDFSIWLAVICLVSGSFIAAAAVTRRSRSLMRVVALTVPFDFVILINYISLAELVDKDNGAAVADSKLEDMIEDHHTDRAACVVTMVMDLLLIACSMFLAEACFELSRAFRGESPSSRPRILDLFSSNSHSNTPGGSKRQGLLFLPRTLDAGASSYGSPSGHGHYPLIHPSPPSQLH
jgi:hypothetical protein